MPNILETELITQQIEQVKSNIERVISSYRHDWDIYTELLQNSADAILEKFGAEHLSQGEISLSIDTNSRKIVIQDNGIGISEDDISRILVNGKSLKRERDTGKFGFMGFGFTFIAFQSALLRVESVFGGKKASRTYRDLYQFVFNNSDIPNSDEESSGIEAKDTTEETGTRIEVQFPDEFPNDAIEQSISACFRIATKASVFEAVLRTKTIVGCLDPIFNGTDLFSFNLLVDNENIDVSPGYLTTREVVRRVIGQESAFFDRITGYEPLVTATEGLPLSNQDQARKANFIEETIDDLAIGERSPLNARVLISATSKSHINQFNDSLEYGPDEDPDFELEHGLWLSICGMPIGVCLDPFDHSNYLPYTVIVDIKDDFVRRELDAGRKGISSYRRSQISQRILELLRENNFIRYRRYVVGGGDTRISDPLYDPRQELQTKVREKAECDYGLAHSYLPPLEEQEVISLFVDLVGKGHLLGYSIQALSGFQVYDGYLSYHLKRSDNVLITKHPLGLHAGVFDRHGDPLSKDLLIEFKKDLNAIYRDIDRNRKDLSHIDVLVCWDCDFPNRDHLQRDRGDNLRERVLTENVFFGVTHELIGAGRQNPLPIIELKSVIEKLFPQEEGA